MDGAGFFINFSPCLPLSWAYLLWGVQFTWLHNPVGFLYSLKEKKEREKQQKNNYALRLYKFWKDMASNDI